MGEFWRLVAATLLGAMISFGTTYYFERRKEVTTQRLAMQQDQRLLEQAARLVMDELQANSGILFLSLEDSEWWSYPPHDVTNHAWLNYKATLAGLLDEDAWETLSLSYAWQSRFNIWLSMAREGRESYAHDRKQVREPMTGLQITESWRAELQSFSQEITYAENALRPVISKRTSSANQR